MPKEPQELHQIFDLIEKARSDIQSDVLETLRKTLNEVGCDDSCASAEADEEGDSEDATFCPHKTLRRTEGHRTHDLIEDVIENLAPIVASLSKILEEAEAMKAASHQKWEESQAVELSGSDAPVVDSLSGPSNITPPSQPLQPAFMTPPSKGSPLLGIPSEIITHILVIARRLDQNIPAAFACVNSRLRQLTICTPLLWDQIDVMYSSPRTSNHITFSMPVKIHVSFSLPPLVKRLAGEGRIQGFVSYLSFQAARIRSLTAVNTRASWTKLAVDFLQRSRCPNLEVLDIGLENSFDGLLDIGHLDALARIRELTFRHVRINLVNIPRFERIEKLEVIKSMTDTFEDFLLVLSQMTTLQHLSLVDTTRGDIEVVYPPPDPPLPPFTNLKTLAFTHVGRPEMRGVCSRLTTPNLESLSFTSISDYDLSDSLDLDILNVVQANPQLQKLKIIDCYDQDWAAIFKALPFLTHLHVASSDIKDSHLEHLVLDATLENPVCPNLTNLTLVNVLRPTSEVIKNIVLSRTSTPTRVDLVILLGWDADHIHNSDVDIIDQHVRDFELEVFDTEEVLEDQEDATRPDYGSSDEEDWDSESFTSGDRVIMKGELGFDA